MIPDQIYSLKILITFARDWKFHTDSIQASMRKLLFKGSSGMENLILAIALDISRRFKTLLTFHWWLPIFPLVYLHLMVVETLIPLISACIGTENLCNDELVENPCSPTTAGCSHNRNPPSKISHSRTGVSLFPTCL